MPAVPTVVCEEAPRVVIVLVWKQHPYTMVARRRRARAVIVAPDDTQEERARRAHDGDVGEQPAAVVVREGVDDLEEEGVARNSAHRVIGDTGRGRAAHPGGVGEEGVEAPVAALGDC